MVTGIHRCSDRAGGYLIPTDLVLSCARETKEGKESRVGKIIEKLKKGDYAKGIGVYIYMHIHV